ncbi:outer membrane protein [Bartonella sp. F02]|uniref:outer membrane protein n=1 Tax=Bartonella sp. F02 TaxID=2967262 RepID=UPI0022A9DA76|nr:outer membrane protein [Bartonella sp. F02]MCZ2328097.1 porin family protein [Bartonella sp. F02]
MNMKCLITVSVFALISASAVQAADVVSHYQPESIVLPMMNPSTFSWSGFYFGGQVSGFSSKTALSILEASTWKAVNNDMLPKISGFMGGVYAGSNVEISDSLIVGVDTGVIWVDKKDMKTLIGGQVISPLAVNEERMGILVPTVGQNTERGNGNLRQYDTSSTIFGERQLNGEDVVNHTLKQKWSGATRARIGFSADRLMPYITGGIAYTQLQDIISLEKKNTKENPTNLFDETKIMVGYTLGAGLDFAMTDNVILRTEYRYSDFGKKKFVKDTLEINYKTNDFRVGIAYKF